MKASEQLAAMKDSQLPRLDWRTLVASGADELSANDTFALDDYFKQFIQR